MSAPDGIHGPFARLVGYHLTDFGPETAEVSLTIEDKHLNRSDILHGGVLTTLIDTACGLAGCHRPPPEPPRRAMTLALTTQFIGRVAAGATLTARATRTGGGRQIFFSACEVRDQDGRLVGRGDGTFRYRSDD